MTFRDGKYYCDICHDTEPIAKGTGFSFPPNQLGIEHSHQSCYIKKQTESNSIAKKDKSKQYMKDNNIGELSDNDIDNLTNSNLAEAKRLIADYKAGKIKSEYDKQK